ncbi:MAG TPA: precorrin-3B synthase [Xanthobacteraceae bacterium]|nr:precorrin-3B synthase [Xanthobacteraceae bacterium]
MNAPHRRGACPGLSAPMSTGDGLLVRLVPAGPIPLDAFVGVCEAARQHGNGIIEISARGSLQVRGFTPCSAPLFPSAVADLGIVAEEGIPVIAGYDLTGARVDTVAAGLRRALAEAKLVLSPKVSVVVDGDGALHLDSLSADIRLRAAEPSLKTRFYVGLGGNSESARWLGSIAPNDVVSTVLGLLKVIAVRGPAARAADILRTEGVGAFDSVLAAFIGPTPAPPRRMPARMIGLHPGRDSTTTVGIGLAFGHSRAETLVELIRTAADVGARAVRSTPGRAILLIGVAETGAVGLRRAAEQLGFVVCADDPRRRIAACPGAPACAAGLIPARALALALAPTLERVMGPGRNDIAVHISGCHKGCAHPMPAALTLVGTAGGCGIIHHGSAGAAPEYHVDPAHLGAEISRIAAKTHEAADG